MNRYALLGATSFLRGSMRMTVSLCVIMVEITNNLQLLPLIMLVLLISKVTNLYFTLFGVFPQKWELIVVLPLESTLSCIYLLLWRCRLLEMPSTMGFTRSRSSYEVFLFLVRNRNALCGLWLQRTLLAQERCSTFSLCLRKYLNMFHMVKLISFSYLKNWSCKVLYVLCKVRLQ
jgi:hypothetical protein